MHRKLLLLIGLCLVLSSPFALAQDKKFEINGILGYTFSSGINVNPVQLGDITIDRISPKSGFSYGVGFDYFLGENFSLGFNWGQERSKLRGRARGLEGIDFTDMNVNNYHGLFTYNWGEEDDALRPYFFGGLGATHYSPSEINGSAVDGSTKFSTTWGGGVKYFTSDHIGFKGGMRWTPTYITTTPGGTWCSPYWPWNCWIVGNAHFSHQFEMAGGIVVRF